MSKAILAWKKLGEEFNRIDTLTAKKDRENKQKILMLHINEVNLCRSNKPCEDKMVKRAKGNTKHFYRVCGFTGHCNLQTREKKLGRENFNSFTSV